MFKVGDRVRLSEQGRNIYTYMPRDAKGVVTMADDEGWRINVMIHDSQSFFFSFMSLWELDTEDVSSCYDRAKQALEAP